MDRATLLKNIAANMGNRIPKPNTRRNNRGRNFIWTLAVWYIRFSIPIY